MGKYAVYAFATFALAMVASVPSQAEMLGGAPVKNGNQCWHGSSGSREGFGYWGACAGSPAQASAARTSTAELRHPLRPRRDQHSDR
jgi:hypothetical protein